MAKYYVGQLIYVKASTEGWFYWTGTHWCGDDIGRAVETVKETLTRAAAEAVKMGPGPESERLFADISRCHSTASGAVGVLKMAESDPAFARSLDQLDADPYLLNMPNGTLDLRKFTVREHDPADLITRVTYGRYFGDSRPFVEIRRAEGFSETKTRVGSAMPQASGGQR